MKARHILFLLFYCAAFGSCAAPRPTDDDELIFLNPDQYMGKTVHLVTPSSPNHELYVCLDSIVEESKDSYSRRYENFAGDSSNHDLNITLGNEVAISWWVSSRPKYIGEFSGYSPYGVLTTDTSGLQEYEYWTIDSLTEISTGNKLSQAELIRSVKSNAVPMRGIFYFSKVDVNSPAFALTNSQIRYAWVKYEAPGTVNEDNNSEPDVMGDILNGVLDVFFSSGNSSTNANTNRDSTNNKDDEKRNIKTGRINGEDRAVKKK